MDLKPIFLISLGRCGSTLVMKLLGSHPKAIAVLDYPSEVRLAQYWISLYSRASRMDPELVDRSALYQQTQFAYNALKPEFLARDHDELTGFLKQRINRFYLHIAHATAKYSVGFLVEKLLFDPEFLDQCHRVYPDLKPILLVRDPRDMICSIISFNKKRGTSTFMQKEDDRDIELVDSYTPILNRMVEWWKEIRGPCFLIRYEDLIIEPISNLSRLFSNLDMEIDSGEVELLSKQVLKP